MRLFIVDAFTDQPFAGNPAAICLLDQEREESWMQAVAGEMNLSETAFLRPINEQYELRWFTPLAEVDLCGHATLAAAHILWTETGLSNSQTLEFRTRSGVLTAHPQGETIELDFPATPARAAVPQPELLEALGVEPVFFGSSPFDRFLAVESESVVRGLQPDFTALSRINMRGVIVTSRCTDARFDFISRYFAPAFGINEDPVTGSAHCCLGPYWAQQLDKSELIGFQASPRGGIVHVKLVGNRVRLGGTAVTVMRGKLT